MTKQSVKAPGPLVENSILVPDNVLQVKGRSWEIRPKSFIAYDRIAHSSLCHLNIMVWLSRVLLFLIDWLAGVIQGGFNLYNVMKGVPIPRRDYHFCTAWLSSSWVYYSSAILFWAVSPLEPRLLNNSVKVLISQEFVKCRFTNLNRNSSITATANAES